ncbi:MAG: hypothetical protein KAH97_05420 [Anaerolineales bacterium]|jgi:Na+/melibiose symporter-like transporter|nr:hypothetical protein [Anaerolineales bacterium]
MATEIARRSSVRDMPPEGATTCAQSEITLNTIRILTGPTVAILLPGAILTAWFYPPMRERYAQVLEELKARRQRETSN